MEIKKNKHADLESKKHPIFLLGLLVSLGFFLMAFEWSTHEINYELPPEQLGELIEFEPAVQNVTIERPKITPPKQEEIIDEELIIEETPEEENEDEKREEQEEKGEENPIVITDSMPDFGEQIKLPEIEGFETHVEQMPTYPGGLAKLYRDLDEKIGGNPTGQSGKIFIEFIVEKDGTLSNVKLKAGFHPMLNQKALDAVKTLDSWNPGIQNYHPVRVKMTLPINYVIK